MKGWIVQQPTDDEVCWALFSLQSLKVPNLDGFTDMFIQRQFFMGSHYGNHTFLTLVPVSLYVPEIYQSTKVPGSLRPFTCVNLIYKLMSKIFADHMAMFIDDFF